MNEDQIPKWLKLKVRKGIYNTVTVLKDFFRFIVRDSNFLKFSVYTILTVKTELVLYFYNFHS